MLDIGLEVKILRERMKLSAKELAEKIGLSQSQMSRLEKGQRRIDTGILARISAALEVDPSHFFRGSEMPVAGVIPPADPGGVGKQVRSERRSRHISAEDLATRVGATKAKILSIEEGKRAMEPELAEKICKVLKLPTSYFLTHQQRTIERLEAQVIRLNQALAEDHRGTATGTGAQAVPVLGTLVSGYPDTFDAAGEPTAEADEFLHLPGLQARGAFALHVVGDSMTAEGAARFAEGDLVVFARGALKSRDFAFVDLRESAPDFRQIFFDAGSKVRLQPLNLNYSPRSCSRDDILGMWRLHAHIARY